ncbi:hypothetical protein JHD49_02675 [Sulfurimonas sp. SAG-AH-194-C21]|nr:hypothetical protein [Sulfurimonas sp. SAG-AH-194-C21]MDF1882838.1 hypothetical protein [Sulfurimonas sp. SAG-AH-194-C21]
MKYIFAFLLLVPFIYGDVIKYKTLACPSVELLTKAQDVDMKDSLKLEMYSIANNCVVLSREDHIKALGYDPLNAEGIFQQILYKKTSTELYILRDAIHIEQAGKKNIYRF